MTLLAMAEWLRVTMLWFNIIALGAIVLFFILILCAIDRS